jgi:hypothetical protein
MLTYQCSRLQKKVQDHVIAIPKLFLLTSSADETHQDHSDVVPKVEWVGMEMGKSDGFLCCIKSQNAHKMQWSSFLLEIQEETKQSIPLKLPQRSVSDHHPAPRSIE